jgi:hypothetical protein
MKNKYYTEGDTTHIVCHHKKATVLVKIDTKDLPVVSSIEGTWGIKTDRTSRGTQYCICNSKKPDGSHTTITMHRLITNATDPDKPVDHRDGDGLNNKSKNLRITSRSGNGRNRFGSRSDNKSGYTGVSFQAKANKWKATINVSGKQKYLGIFNELEEAISVRKAAERKYGYSRNTERGDK